MTAIQEIDFNYKYFLDRSTLLFGASGTGKSFIVTDILFQLQPHIEQIIVISPMDRQNHTYDKGIVPLPCIHYTITAKLLDDIWERQSALSAVYTKANNPELLRKLFDHIPNNERTRGVIDSVNRKLHDYRKEIEKSEPNVAVARSKVTEMSDECGKLISLIFKQCINENRSKLQKLNLTKTEQFSLKYLNLNPRLVLIFDDCTDLLKKFKSHPVMQKLFYQGRWAFITALFACHTDKALDPELKKSSYINIFTEDLCAHSYFERKTNDLDKEARVRAAAACKATFTPIAKYQKLAWIRDEGKFYRFTATSHQNFKFGSQYVWEYCKQIQAEAGTVTTDNKFIHEFN